MGLGDGAHLLDWCNSPHSGKFCFSPISNLVGNPLGLREASTYPLSSAVAFCRLAVLSFSCLLVCFVSPAICRSVSVSAPSLKVNYRAIALFCCQISLKIVFYYSVVRLRCNQMGYP